MLLRLAQIATVQVVLLSTSLAAQSPVGDGDKPLENADIVAMKRAGIGESVILAAIQGSPLQRLDGSLPALNALRDAGLHQPILTAVSERLLVQAQAPSSVPKPEQKQASTTPPKDSLVVHAQSAPEVKLFFTERPSQPFVERGRVSVSKYSTFGRTKKRDAIDEELKSQAIQLGGDAIINISEDFASISGVVVRFGS